MNHPFPPHLPTLPPGHAAGLRARGGALAAFALLATLATLCAWPAQAQPEDPAALQTVVVTATRHAMTLIDAPAAMSVVTREQIERRGADSVLDALRGELGVSLTPRPISGRKAISLRGMDSRHTLVLVDGKRIGASDGVIGHSDFQHDWIPAEDIERIEVIRGPMSVLYGAEALGGVVNIITRPVGERWAFSTLAEAAVADDPRGGDGHRAALRAAGPLGAGFSLALGATETRRDRVASPGEPRISDLEGKHKRDAWLRLGWQPVAEHRLDLEHREGDEDRDAGMRERSGARRFFISESDIDRRHTALGWQAGWGGAADWRTQLRAYRSEVGMSNRRSQGVAALRPNQLRDDVAEGQASFEPAPTQRVSIGFERRDEALRNDGLPGGHAQARHAALYGQHEWQLAPALGITLGLRGDHASGFGSEWSPRAYAVWHPAPGWTVKGGAGHGFKAPTLKQISPDYAEDEGPFTYHGNADLRPETNDAIELGGGWESAFVSAQAMLFHNRVKDLIITRQTGVVAGRRQYIFDNEDSATLRGLEWTAAVRVARDFRFTLNHLLLDAKDDQGQPLDKRARHTLGLRLEYARAPFDAGLHLEHTRGLRLATGVVGQPPQAVPVFTMLGLHLGVQVRPGLDFGFAIDNLGNLRLADKSPLVTQAETPRTLRLSLRGRW